MRLVGFAVPLAIVLSGLFGYGDAADGASSSGSPSRPPRWRPGNTGTGRRVRIVTDWLLDPAGREQGAHGWLYPAHSWIQFDAGLVYSRGQIMREPAMRVELASPILNQSPSGLVMAVTEYNGVPPDLGGDFSVQTPGIRRMVNVLERNTTLRNDQIFSPGLAGGSATDGGGEAPSGALVSTWIQNSLYEDGHAVDLEDHQFFASCHAFAAVFLSSLGYADAELSIAKQTALHPALQWANLRRGRRFWNGSPPSIAAVNHLVHDFTPSTGEREQGAEKVVTLFELDKSHSPAYTPRVAVDGWETLMPPGDNETAVPWGGSPSLSRDPWLTSNVLAVDEGGSFVGWSPCQLFGVGPGQGPEGGASGSNGQVQNTAPCAYPGLLAIGAWRCVWNLFNGDGFKC